MLMAGLDGIEKKMKPPAPVEEDVYEFDDKKLAEKSIGTLPHSLWEAVLEMQKAPVIMDALGPHSGPKYVEAKKQEWDEYRLQVTPWEMKKYYDKT